MKAYRSGSASKTPLGAASIDRLMTVSYYPINQAFTIGFSYLSYRHQCNKLPASRHDERRQFGMRLSRRLLGVTTTSRTARGLLRYALLGFASSALVSGSSLGWCLLLTFQAQAAAAPTAAHAERPVAVGQPAPPLALPDLAGQIVTLNAYQGHPLIINFWATWCAPCREEMPLLQQVHNAHQRAGLVVLGISQDSEERFTAVRTYWTQSGWSFPSLLDPDGAVAQRYQVFLIPSTIFINAQGVVTAMHRGPINAAQIEQYLAKILE